MTTAHIRCTLYGRLFAVGGHLPACKVGPKGACINSQDLRRAARCQSLQTALKSPHMSSAVFGQYLCGVTIGDSDSTRMPTGFYFEDALSVLSLFSGMDRSSTVDAFVDDPLLA